MTSNVYLDTADAPTAAPTETSTVSSEISTSNNSSRRGSNRDDKAAMADKIKRSRSPSILLQSSAQVLAPPKLTIGQQSVMSARPTLRTRSTDCVTTSSQNAHHASSSDSNSRGDNVSQYSPTTEFAVAELPSPILAHPNQGLAGLSEALVHLVNKSDSQLHSSDVSPTLSRQQSAGGGHASENDGQRHLQYSLSPAAVTAMIAQASNSGRRLSTGNALYGADDAEQSSSRRYIDSVSPSQNASAASSRRPSGTIDRLRMDFNLQQQQQQQQQQSSTSHNAFSPSTSSKADSQSHVPTLFTNAGRSQRSSQTTGAPPTSSAPSEEASQRSSPIASGVSTPMHKSSSRSKPKVLETTHLHLQTHGPSGRRMINQFIIEDELGRGVHGKVRLARNTESGERVAVKIVEREAKKRLGAGGQAGSAFGNRLLRNKFKGKDSGSFALDDAAEGESGGDGPPIVSEDYVGSKGGAQQTRFAPPPVKPSSPMSSQRSAASAIRLGRWGEGAPSRPTYGDLEIEKQREAARKRLLWTTDQKVKREIAIMKKCSHENVVGLKEVIDDPQSKKIFMVLEYMEGGEVQWKDDRGFPTLTVDEARRTLRDVVLGLEYLHYQGIIHRDIKPANLLWDKDHRVKISDFGVSHFSYALLVASGGLPSYDGDEERQKDPSLADDRDLAKTAGSPAFFAPELCMAGDPAFTTLSTASAGSQHQGQRHDNKQEFPWLDDKRATSSPAQTPGSSKRTRPPVTKAIDVWALGVTLYCLLFGHVPFTADSEFALFSVIAREDFHLPTYMGADRVRIGPRKKRWVYQQPWTDEEGDVDDESNASIPPDVDPSTLSEDALMVRDLLDRLLEKDPTKRIKLDEVKKHPWVVRDIADPPQWLNETDPAHLPFVEVTHEDVETALTGFSKFKQTLKRFQTKLLSSFGSVGHGHSHYERSSRSSSRPSTPRDSAASSTLGAPVRRRRSKSASHASRELPPASIRTAATTVSSAQTSPQQTIDLRRSTILSGGKSSSAGVASGVSGAHPPIAPSAKPHHFFSRNRSNVLDNEKQMLGVKRSGKSVHVHRTSVSQPNSPPRSPTSELPSAFLASDDVHSTIHPAHLTKAHSAQGQHHHHQHHLHFLRRPRHDEQAHGVDEKHSINRSTKQRPSSRGLWMRPQSRNSLRNHEAVSPMTSINGDQESSDRTHEGDVQVRSIGTPSSSRNPSSSSAGPGRPRSRSRISDVFKGILGGNHHHVGFAGEEERSSARIRSRPATTANSAAASPTLDRNDVKPNVLQKRATSQGVVPRLNASLHLSKAELPADNAANSIVLDEHSSQRCPTSAQTENGEGSQQTHQSGTHDVDLLSPDASRAIDVDDYDVDLDFSEEDDDSMDDHVRSKKQNEMPIFRGTRDGWIGEGGIHRRASVHDDNGDKMYAVGESAANSSLTPSVEGGYNVFKPPYAGRFQLNSERQSDGHNEEAYAMDVVHSDEVAALRRANPADTGVLSTSIGGASESSMSALDQDIPYFDTIAIGKASRSVDVPYTKMTAQPGDKSSDDKRNERLGDVTEDRFADADEQRLPLQPRHVSPLSGQELLEAPRMTLTKSGDGAYDDTSPAAIEDDDCGVSFQAGRRSTRC